MSEIKITKHALTRYRERWAPDASAEEAIRMLEACVIESRETALVTTRGQSVRIHDCGARLVVKKCDSSDDLILVTVLESANAWIENAREDGEGVAEDEESVRKARLISLRARMYECLVRAASADEDAAVLVSDIHKYHQKYGWA